MFICYFFAYIWFGFLWSLGNGIQWRNNFWLRKRLERKFGWGGWGWDLYVLYFASLTLLIWGLSYKEFESNGTFYAYYVVGTAWLALIMIKVTSFVMALKKLVKQRINRVNLHKLLNKLDQINNGIFSPQFSKLNKL